VTPAKPASKPKAAESSVPATSSRTPLDIAVVLAIANTVLVAGAAGLMAYSKLLFKRPPITEISERTRLAKEKKKPSKLIPGFVAFDTVTVNIAPSPARPEALEGAGVQLRGKLHYATVAFHVELRDVEKRPVIDALRPQIMDDFLSIIGRKSFNDLSSAQGRYLLRTQMIESMNRLVASTLHQPQASQAAPGPSPAPGPGESSPPGDHKQFVSLENGLVTNVFFSQFVVQ
jgi:flagellar basal body-associated protein FliL